MRDGAEAKALRRMRLVGRSVSVNEVLVFYPVFLSNWTHHQVSQEADDQQAAHDVQDDWVGVLFVHVVFYVMVEDAVNDEGTNDAGCRPRGEQTSVDGRDVETAEEVLEVGRN